MIFQISARDDESESKENSSSHDPAIEKAVLVLQYALRRWLIRFETSSHVSIVISSYITNLKIKIQMMIGSQPVVPYDLTCGKVF